MNVRHRVNDSIVRQRLTQIARQSGDLSAPLNECAEIQISSIEENFNVEGRFSEAGSWRGGSNKWPKSGAAKARGGMTLSDSGQLRFSIQKKVTSNKAEVGTNKEYAAVHNFGFDGTVTVKEHKRKTRSGKMATVRSHSRHMRVFARPYMVTQEDDVNDMIDALDRHIMK